MKREDNDDDYGMKVQIGSDESSGKEAFWEMMGCSVMMLSFFVSIGLMIWLATRC